MSFWWPRALRPILVGLLLGGVLGWGVGLLPDRYEGWGLLALLGALLVFMVWQWMDLRRSMHQLDEALERLARETDWPR